MSDIEREAFEQWCMRQEDEHGLPFFVMKDDDGGYIDHGTVIAWQAWQAARQAPASGEVDEDGKGSLPWFVHVYNSGYEAGHHDTVEGGFTPIHHSDKDTYHEDVVMEILEDLNVATSKDDAHPPAKVPDGFEVLRRPEGIIVTRQSDGGCAFYEKGSRLVTQVMAYRFLDALLTTPTPATTAGAEWKPAHEMSDDLPPLGEPVMGFHQDWIDEDFCKDGIRECFLFGDGSEWQSARWDGYSDQWIVEDGAPELWHSHPAPPQEQ